MKASRDHAKVAFERMKTCMFIAKHGAEKAWVDGGNFVVPVATRYNQPDRRAASTRRTPPSSGPARKRMLYSVWDGSQETLKAAMAAVMQPPPDPLTGLPTPDPTLQA